MSEKINYMNECVKTSERYRNKEDYHERLMKKNGGLPIPPPPKKHKENYPVY